MGWIELVVRGGLEEGDGGRMPGRRAILDSTRLDSTRTCPPHTVGKKEVYYTMGSPVYKTTMTAWPAFLGFGGREKGEGLDLEESSDISILGRPCAM